MTSLAKALGVALAIIILMQAALLLLASFQAKAEPSTIIDFSPSDFSEQVATPFFYSIGPDLKFGRYVNPHDKSFFSGTLQIVIPSPDGTKAMVVSGGVLWIVTTDSTPPRRVMDVADLYVTKKPIGKQFFRSSELQWSSDSSKIYLIKDEYYASKGSQLFSSHGELYEYNLPSGELRRLLSPFRAYRYFLVDDTGIFFSEPNDQGDVILKAHLGDAVAVVDSISRDGFTVGNKSMPFASKPFYTFSIHEYAQDILRSLGVILKVEGENDRVAHLLIGGRKMISVREGRGLKGPCFGYQSLRSVFLPGNRYFLLNVYTGTFDGQVLFDVETGRYKPLPKDTRVYVNVNTWNFSDWIVTKTEQVKVDLTKDERSSYPW